MTVSGDSGPGDQPCLGGIGFRDDHSWPSGSYCRHHRGEDSCDWAHETRDYLQGTRDELPSLLDEHLPGASMILPESTFLAWIDLSGVRSPRLREALAAGRTAQQLLLEEAKVSLTDGALCGRGSEAHVRLNFGMPRPVLREAFARMGRALA